LYVAVVASIAFLRAAVGVPHPADLASTPAGVARGQLWTLVTSAFVVSGPVIPQLASLTVVGGLVIRREGPRVYWWAAAWGHLGSAVVAYAAVGLLTVAGVRVVHRVLYAPDYGVSCVWAGMAGALAASVATTLRHRPNRIAQTALITCCTTLLGLAAVVGSVLVRAEHLLALLLGAGVTLAAANARRGSP
jgi:hypothetical protein